MLCARIRMQTYIIGAFLGTAVDQHQSTQRKWSKLFVIWSFPEFSILHVWKALNFFLGPSIRIHIHAIGTHIIFSSEIHLFVSKRIFVICFSLDIEMTQMPWMFGWRRTMVVPYHMCVRCALVLFISFGSSFTHKLVSRMKESLLSSHERTRWEKKIGSKKMKTNKRYPATKAAAATVGTTSWKKQN